MARLRRSCLPVVVLALVLAACGGGGAHQAASSTTTTFPPNTPAHITTWTLTSKYVDPTAVKMAPPPAGVAPRPNVLRVNVYLPTGYDGIRRFPVLFLLNGAESAYDYWADPERGDVLNTAKGFDGIIVMPEAGANGWYTDWWNGGQRANPAWESFYLDELIPYVEQHLAVLPDRQNHAIAGFSMGGGGAVYLASQVPGYFGSVASLSGTLSIERPEWQTFNQAVHPLTAIWGDPVAQEFYWAGHNPKALVQNLATTRVYVGVGDGTPDVDPAEHLAALSEANLREHAQDFTAEAKAAGVPVALDLYGGIHDWPCFRQGLINAIRWNLFAPVPQTPSSWTYVTVAQRGDVYGYKFAFQEPPTSIETLALNDGTLTGNGSGNVTVTTPSGQTLSLTMAFKG